MIFSIGKINEHITTYFKINKGDLIFTGTPAGVSSVQIGDVLQGYLENKELFRFEIK